MNDLMSKLHRATRAAESMWRREDITPRQYVVLRAILNHTGGEPCQRQICLATGVDRSTLTDILRRLEAAGLITRTRQQSDQRRVTTALTPAGIKAVKHGDKEVAVIERKLLASIHSADQPAFAAAIGALAKIASVPSP